MKGIEHPIEVTADSLYEAVAQGLRTFRENDWIDDIGRGQTTITVVVRQPGVEHKVRVRDFEQWLESQGRTPAEMSLKSPITSTLGEVTFLVKRSPPDAKLTTDDQLEGEGGAPGRRENKGRRVEIVNL